MHIFIAGGGHCAEYLARRLIQEGNDITIVERDPVRRRDLEETLDAQIVLGSASSITDWRKAGLAGADMVIAATPSDEVNVMACLIANTEAPDAVKALRLRTHEFAIWQDMLEARGVRIDRVIHPETDVVARIFRVLRVPGVSDIRDFAEARVKVFGMNVEPTSWLAGRYMHELERKGAPRNAMIPMIFRDQRVIIPHGDEQLRAGDHIYVATTEDELDACLGFMGIEKRDTIRRVFIIGAEIGYEVAKALETEGISVKLFDTDARQCEKVCGLLKSTVVINADGSDQQTLLRENIEGVDAFIAVTKDDDVNLISSLLARRLGSRKLVALVNRLDYLGLAQRLGINTTVSLRMKAADAVMEFVRKGGVLSVRTFHEEEAEAIELVVPTHSPYIGRPLRDISFPREAIVGAIARPNGETLIPRGEAIIQAGDRVVFFSSEGVVRRLESEFLAKSSR